MPRLVVVLPVRPLEAGDGFALRDWPLHVTVAPTFVVALDLATVVGAISPLLESQPALTVRAGPDEGFGPSLDIPVTVIEPSAELTALHARLIAALRGVGAEFDDPEFIGDGYRAHVTVRRADRLCPGDSVELAQATIVDMAPQGDARLRRVVWAMALRRPDEPR